MLSPIDATKSWSEQLTKSHIILFLCLTDEVRNDFYLNLFEAEFEKGSKTAERNVEAKVLVVNKTGEVKVGLHSLLYDTDIITYLDI